MKTEKLYKESGCCYEKNRKVKKNRKEMEIKRKKERNGKKAVFLWVFHEKTMDSKEYPYQTSPNGKIEREF